MWESKNAMDSTANECEFHRNHAGGQSCGMGKEDGEKNSNFSGMKMPHNYLYAFICVQSRWNPLAFFPDFCINGIMKLLLLRLMLAAGIVTSAYSQTTTFRVSTNLVLTPVWVADAEGKAVRNLKIEDFEIEENGIKAIPMRLGEPGEASLELALLLDVSGSMTSRFDMQQQAASGFLKRVLRPIDAVFLLSISNAPKILLSRTSSLEEAVQTINKIPPTTKVTAFYNSIVKAAQMLQVHAPPEARRVIIALSEGEDNGSLEHELKDALRELHEADCLFYSINPKGSTYQIGFLGRRAQENMEAMAKQTGGAAFAAKTAEDLSVFFERIADELQNQYLLGYDSPAAGGAGTYRRIVIRVKGRPELQVKARPGYFVH
jgi:Ca-activated chloride channel homolog